MLRGILLSTTLHQGSSVSLPPLAAAWARSNLLYLTILAHVTKDVFCDGVHVNIVEVFEMS